MATAITPTYAENYQGRGTGIAASSVAGPIKRHSGHRLTIVRVDNVDGTASDYVDASTIGIRGIISAAFKADATADAANVTTTAKRVTFSGVNADCDGYLWILSAA